jgi:hypothetical protein
VALDYKQRWVHYEEWWREKTYLAVLLDPRTALTASHLLRRGLGDCPKNNQVRAEITTSSFSILLQSEKKTYFICTDAEHDKASLGGRQMD